MKCPKCVEELTATDCYPLPGERGFYWVCPYCNYSSRCMTESEFKESQLYRPDTKGVIESRRYPTNKQMKVDRERFLVHQMLEAALALTNANSRLLLSHYEEAKAILTELWDQIRDIINLIPEEGKIEAGNQPEEQNQGQG